MVDPLMCFTCRILQEYSCGRCSARARYHLNIFFQNLSWTEALQTQDVFLKSVHADEQLPIYSEEILDLLYMARDKKKYNLHSGRPQRKIKICGLTERGIKTVLNTVSWETAHLLWHPLPSIPSPLCHMPSLPSLLSRGRKGTSTCPLPPVFVLQ
ncbi:hypothetical protein XELAEV_18038669mg [Xenopus laevis]|uniref:Uncharacterized protein n=1 Tax=Xenopus laevis TaxID=8355 RepID=A0A974C6F3_XENLA|nr:hypothetical protein XELAEV_18038669mg [Xenopus laevis]